MAGRLASRGALSGGGGGEEGERGEGGEGGAPGRGAAMRIRLASGSGPRTLAALAAGLAVMAAVVGALGKNPLRAAAAVVDGSLGNSFGIGQTVQIWTILILAGLASAIPFSARLWNIGGQGQMYSGAIAAAALGITLPASWPGAVVVPLILAASTAAGASWGWLPAWIRNRYGASEIVTTLMLNFVAVLGAAYVIRDAWPDRFAQQTEAVADNARLPVLIGSVRADISIVLAVAAALGLWVLMTRTRLGFAVRALGANRGAALLSGASESAVASAAFALGGAAAGLGGGVFVLGIHGALLNGFSAGLAFLGIAVALAAGLNPLRVIPVAGLFAILRVGSNNLQAGADLSPATGDVLIAVFVIMLMVVGVIRFSYGELVDG